MNKDPYAAGKFAANPYADKTDVTGSLVAILRGKLADRGLELIKPISRCIRRDEIHELILTDEDARPGGRVDSIAYLGFAEFASGGVIVAGDAVHLDGRQIGTLAGFDETHMPNHLNIVIRTTDLTDGVGRGARLGMTLSFVAARD